MDNEENSLPTSVLLFTAFILKLPEFVVKALIRFIENKVIPFYSFCTNKKPFNNEANNMTGVMLTRLKHDFASVTWKMRPEYAEEYADIEVEEEEESEGLDILSEDFIVEDVLAVKEPTSIYNIHVAVRPANDRLSIKQISLSSFLLIFAAKDGEIRFFDA